MHSNNLPTNDCWLTVSKANVSLFTVLYTKFYVCFHRVYELDTDKDKKKKIKMHAKQYIDTAMMNIQKQLGDEQLFPTKFGT